MGMRAAPMQWGITLGLLWDYSGNYYVLIAGVLDCFSRKAASRKAVSRKAAPMQWGTLWIKYYVFINYWRITYILSLLYSLLYSLPFSKCHPGIT